jgi:hypothetical protein
MEWHVGALTGLGSSAARESSRNANALSKAGRFRTRSYQSINRGSQLVSNRSCRKLLMRSMNGIMAMSASE